MIYLVEDRLPRQKQFLQDYELPEDRIRVISDIHFSNTPKQIDSASDDQFPNAEAVLCHKGHVFFNDKSNLLTEFQKYYIKKHVPFVFFSGSISSANYTSIGSTFGANVNSRIFYGNLKYYLETSPYDVRILCFGRRYLLNEFMIFTNIVSAKLHSFDNNTKLEESTRQFLYTLTEGYEINKTAADSDIYKKAKQLFVRRTEPLTVETIKEQLRRALLQANAVKL